MGRLQRFEQEAWAAAALNHPNILAVFQMGTHEGAPYLVSELLHGGTLRGLAAAHENGVVHRDLKPENLFITNDGRSKDSRFWPCETHTAPSGVGGQRRYSNGGN